MDSPAQRHDRGNSGRSCWTFRLCLEQGPRQHCDSEDRSGNGALALVGHAPTNGRTPRYFTFDPTGAYVLVGNQGSNTVVVYRVDPNSGNLAVIQTLTDVPEPASIVFVPVPR